MPLRKSLARFARVLAGVGVIGGLLGCASTAPPVPELVAVDPFRVPAVDFRRSVHRLCIDSLTSEIEMEDGDPRLSSFEERIVERLERAGFEVVGLRQIRKARAGIGEEPGEAFDAHTGRAIPGVALAFSSHVRERLTAILDCDAFVSIDLAVVQAFWDDRLVFWDGREVWADGREDADQLAIALRDAYIGGVRGWGSIPALSLQVAIRDCKGRLIFWHAAGIQPVATLRNVPYQIRWDPLPDDRILIDPESNQTAVDLAVGPLDARPGTTMESER